MKPAGMHHTYLSTAMRQYNDKGPRQGAQEPLVDDGRRFQELDRIGVVMTVESSQPRTE